MPMTLDVFPLDFLLDFYFSHHHPAINSHSLSSSSSSSPSVIPSPSHLPLIRTPRLSGPFPFFHRLHPLCFFSPLYLQFPISIPSSNQQLFTLPMPAPAPHSFWDKPWPAQTPVPQLPESSTHRRKPALPPGRRKRSSTQRRQATTVPDQDAIGSCSLPLQRPFPFSYPHCRNHVPTNSFSNLSLTVCL